MFRSLLLSLCPPSLLSALPPFSLPHRSRRSFIWLVFFYLRRSDRAVHLVLDRFQRGFREKRGNSSAANIACGIFRVSQSGSNLLKHPREYSPEHLNAEVHQVPGVFRVERVALSTDISLS